MKCVVYLVKTLCSWVVGVERHPTSDCLLYVGGGCAEGNGGENFRGVARERRGVK